MMGNPHAENAMNDRPTPEEPVRGPGSGIQVPDSAVERHLREAAGHVKPAEDAPGKRPSADRREIAEPWRPKT